MHCHSLSSRRWDVVRCYIGWKIKKRSSNVEFSSRAKRLPLMRSLRADSLFQPRRTELNSALTLNLVDFALKWCQTGVLQLLMTVIYPESVDWYTPPPPTQPPFLLPYSSILSEWGSVCPIRRCRLLARCICRRSYSRWFSWQCVDQCTIQTAVFPALINIEYAKII